jgi:hypothetical protein
VPSWIRGFAWYSLVTLWLGAGGCIHFTLAATSGLLSAKLEKAVYLNFVKTTLSRPGLR